MFFKGGHMVEAGTYWNTSTGERYEVAEDHELPGSEQTISIKAKSGLVLLAAPVLGLAFALFLPLIGIVMTMGPVGKTIAGTAVGHAVQSVSFGWRPIEAYLSGRKRKKEATHEEKK